tara:strand:+ start:119 stop:223 length:105 start_codon:yes stop_codon:yes gene_type:complete
MIIESVFNKRNDLQGLISRELKEKLKAANNLYKK